MQLPPDIWACLYHLNGRIQRVTVLGATSQERMVTSGVPQGSILGPVLFLLYVNDLPRTVKSSKVACFADDTEIVHQQINKNMEHPTY